MVCSSCGGRAMPQWIHDRAMSMLPDMKKTYGPKKAKSVAFAVSTQMAHATGQAPKTWHGKPFGTPQGKRVAKQKFDEPSKMQKAATPVSAAEGHLGRLMGVPIGAGGPKVLADELRKLHQIASGKTLGGVPAGLVPEARRLASEEHSWMSQHAKSASKLQKSASEIIDILMGKVAQEQPQQSEHKGPGFQIVDHTGQSHWLDASTIHSKMDLEKAVTPLMSECPHGVVREKIEEGWKALAESRRAAGQPVKEEPAEPKEEKTAAAAINQGSQVPIGSINRDREVLRPTVTPSVMTSSQVPLTPPSGMGNTNTSLAAAEPTEDEVADFFQRHPNPPDDVLHRWAVSRGWEPDEVEGRAYRLATAHAQFLSGGKANEAGKKPEDVSPEQLAKGVVVEKEHTPNLDDRKRISTDHIVEDPKYYNDPMFKSDLAKSAVLEGFRKLFKEPPRRKPRGEIIDLADEAASRSSAKWASLAPVIPHFLGGLAKLGVPR